MPKGNKNQPATHLSPLENIYVGHEASVTVHHPENIPGSRLNSGDSLNLRYEDGEFTGYELSKTSPKLTRGIQVTKTSGNETCAMTLYTAPPYTAPAEPPSLPYHDYLSGSTEDAVLTENKNTLKVCNSVYEAFERAAKNTPDKRFLNVSPIVALKLEGLRQVVASSAATEGSFTPAEVKRINRIADGIAK